jgi:hypothetical protein
MVRTVCYLFPARLCMESVLYEGIVRPCVFIFCGPCELNLSGLARSVINGIAVIIFLPPRPPPFDAL